MPVKKISLKKLMDMAQIGILSNEKGYTILWGGNLLGAPDGTIMETDQYIKACDRLKPGVSILSNPNEFL